MLLRQRWRQQQEDRSCEQRASQEGSRCSCIVVTRSGNAVVQAQAHTLGCIKPQQQHGHPPSILRRPRPAQMHTEQAADTACQLKVVLLSSSMVEYSRVKRLAR